MPKGDLLLKALEIFEGITCNTAGFVDAFLASNKSNYLALKKFKPHEHPHHPEEKTEARKSYSGTVKEKQRVYELLTRLHKQELIEKTDGADWKITERGRFKLALTKDRLRKRLPTREYQLIKGGSLLIVSFDVPEKEKHKRDWLRAVLVRVGLRMLQKSVWVGRVRLPRELMEDLDSTGLIPYLEIFAVTKSGTIRHLA